MLNDFRFECIGEIDTDDEMLIGELNNNLFAIISEGQCMPKLMINQPITKLND